VTPALLQPEIDFAAFSAVDGRAGTLGRAADVPGPDKLHRLAVNCGDHAWRVLSSIKRKRGGPRSAPFAMPESPVPTGTRAG